MSFAGPKDEVVEQEIARMSGQGTVFIAAAGNAGPTALPLYPAGYKQVIAVTAINKDARSYSYANRGDHIDIAAPGVDVWTAVPGAKEGYYSGTSFAAPFVTAMIATLYGQSPQRGKDHLLAQLDVQDLGVPGKDAVYGRGLAKAPKTCAPAAMIASAPQRPSPAKDGPPVIPVSTGWEPSVTATSPASKPSPVSAAFR